MCPPFTKPLFPPITPPLPSHRLWSHQLVAVVVVVVVVAADVDAAGQVLCRNKFVFVVIYIYICSITNGIWFHLFAELIDNIHSMIISV